MSELEQMAIVEAILFVSDKDVSLSEIAGILNVKISHVENLMDVMIDKFQTEQRGLIILKAENTYRLATSPAYKAHVEKFTGKNKIKELSSSCLETLSLVAYNQPITRLQLEKLMDKNCAHSLMILIKNGLISEKGRLKSIGRPIQYGTSVQFLRRFGLSSLDELPDIKAKV